MLKLFNRNKNSPYRLKAVLEEENRKKIQNAIVTYHRILFMMAVITVAILGLFIRVYFLTISQHEFYTSKLQFYQTKVYSASVPRGSIYDRNGKELVTTTSDLTIMYCPVKGITNDQEMEMATKLVENIEVDISHLGLRDKKDYYIMYYPDEAQKLITDDEWKRYRDEELTDKDIYNLKLERITEDLINATWNEQELKATHIYYLMNKNLSDPSTIVEGITEKEASYIAEHSDIYRGMYVSCDYSRVYNFGAMFKQVFGKVSTSTQGLPQEKSNYYLALGYQMTSSVGTSGIEKQYESLLSGSPNEYTIDYDDYGNTVKSTVSNGQKGYNISLTIDWDLQEFLDQRIEYWLKRSVNLPLNYKFDNLFVTMVDPNTGEVLGMSGKHYNRTDGSIVDYSEGNYTEAFAPGSSVKGATLYTGYKTGVLKPGESIYDEPIQIKDTPIKGSWKDNLGLLNDTKALAVSSNIYMMHVVIRVAGGHYVKNQPLSLDYGAYKTLRESFGELGLGVLTGLDVPNEQLGVKGQNITVGNMLDFAIGQYDTYSTVQLAQYISTIANGGKRLQLHLVKDAWSNENGEKHVVYKNTKNVLDDVTQYGQYIARIRQGMYEVVNTAYGTVHGAINPSLKVAGKTGTAEIPDFEKNVMLDNRIFVGFAPYDNPRVAYACFAPNQETVESVSTCIHIANEAFTWYKENRGY